MSSPSHAFIRHDAIRKYLKRLHHGFLSITKRSGKHYTLSVKLMDEEVLSLNRLKPACLDDSPTLDPETLTEYIKSPISSPSPSAKSLQKNQTSGRHVHWPRRFVFHLTEGEAM